MENENTLVIFTDGAYSSLKERGGWAFYCPQYNCKMCGGENGTTNNRMEMMAVIKALEWIDEACAIESDSIPHKNIVIISDSQYVIQTMLGKYQKKTNLDLWGKLDDCVSSLFFKKISWVHVKGHAGHEENEIVDKLAVLASQM